MKPTAFGSYQGEHGFNLAYLTNTTAADFIVPNSDRVLSSVDIGYTTILWKRTLLNVTGQFGLTGNVPDFRHGSFAGATCDGRTI